METQQAVQVSAQVVRITNVKAGDVYKRFDKDYDDRVYFGVVKAVHNDGDNAIIEAVEYNYRYSSLSVDYKVLKGKNDYILFPCTPEELNLELDKARKSEQRKIEDAQETIEKSTRLLQEIDGLITGETQKKLTMMSYKEMTQAKYHEAKQLI